MPLITFEGINGSGKTTQIERLSRYYAASNIPIFTTKEPASLGSEIRQMTIDRQDLSWKTRLLLYMADRTENIDKNIAPNLAQHRYVLCDRYSDSTIAYQVYGNKLNAELIQKFNKLTCDKYQPDLTIWLDLKPQTSFDRNECREDRSSRHDYSLSYIQRVYKGYQILARDCPERIVRVDANRAITEVTREIAGIIRTKFGGHFNRCDMPVDFI